MACVKRRKVCKLEVTPWCGREEFVKVKEALFSWDVYKMKWALDVIRMWEKKSYPALPTGIAVSLSLFRAVLTEKLLKEDKDFGDQLGNSMLYSAGVIRFLNLVCEFVRNDHTSQDIRASAAKLHIPAWIVDLRHRATHAATPLLGDLQSGARLAIDWLEENYWNKYLTSIEDYIVPETVPNDDFDKFVETYKDMRLQLLDDSLNILEKKHLKSELNTALNHMRNQLMKRSEEFFAALLKPTAFFIDRTSLIKHLSEEEFNFLDASASSELSAESLALPLFIMKLWAPLIKTINSVFKIPQFVSELLSHSKSFTLFHQKIACAWALKLINVVAESDLEDRKTVASDPITAIYRKQEWLFDSTSLTTLCVRNPSQHTAIILERVIDNIYPPLTEEARRDLTMLFSLRLSDSFPNYASEPGTFQRPVQKLLTMQDLQEEALIRVKMENDSTVVMPPHKNIWNVTADGKDWSTIPLGSGVNDKSAGSPFQPKAEELPEAAVSNQPKAAVSNQPKAAENSSEARARKHVPLVSERNRASNIEEMHMTEADFF